MPYRHSAVLTTVTERFQCANLLLAAFSPLREQCERKDTQLPGFSSCLPQLLPFLFTCSIWEGHVEREKEEGKCHNPERREFPLALWHSRSHRKLKQAKRKNKARCQVTYTKQLPTGWQCWRLGEETIRLMILLLHSEQLCLQKPTSSYSSR